MKGAFKKHPERKRARENEPTDIPELGKPPDYLNEFERAAWKVGAIDGAALPRIT
jgi:hypothetical protein